MLRRCGLNVTATLVVLTVGLLVGISGPSMASAGVASVGSTGAVWSTITAGTLHTCGIRLDHTLWCWGSGASGRTGLGDELDRSVPTQVGEATNWASVAVSVDVGFSHTCGTRTDGTLWCWGDNRSGDLGIGGHKGDRYVPTRVGTATAWAQVALGERHTCAIRTDSSLWCWGSNLAGELGIGADDLARVPASGDWSRGVNRACVSRFGHVVRCFAPVRVGSDNDWVALDAGEQHSCAIRLDGSLWCWGANYQGALGTGDTISRDVPTEVGTGIDWSQVALGQYVSCATGTDLTVWCWGQNQWGELGQGDHKPRFLPTQVGSAEDWTNVSENRARTCATRLDGSLWCWGGTSTRPRNASRFHDWTTADTGGGQICGVRANATLWCWGWNYYGQLGLGDQRDRAKSTRV